MTPTAAALLRRRLIGGKRLTVTEIGFGGAPIANFHFDIGDDAAHASMAALWSVESHRPHIPRRAQPCWR